MFAEVKITNMINKEVSVDYDHTLSKIEVQNYVRQLIKEGVTVFILTARYNEMKKHLWSNHPDNSIVFETVTRLGIPLQNIVFTNMEDKSSFLQGTKVAWHLDDDIFVIEEIARNCETPVVDVTKRDWKEKCNELLNN